ncbi:MAG: hypothetical protein P8J32_00655, partial [bacterium]|nr:hypothetical protein [bacterium]
LFNLGCMPGLSSDRWQGSLLGASGEAYVLRTLTARHAARVFLPGPAEDMLDATDVFWIESGVLHAMSVKVRYTDEAGVHTHHLFQQPNRRHRKWSKSELRAIWHGALRHASAFAVACAPTILHIGVKRPNIASLSKDWSRVRWPNPLLSSTTSSHLRVVQSA